MADNTTTDAAEARAPDYIEMAAARMRSIAAIPDMVIDAALNATVPGGARVAAWLPDSVKRDVIRYALHAAFATAEAASGAGEREFTDAQLKDAVTELLDHRGERSRRVLRNGQELWETWLPAFRAAIRYLPAPSLPPATDAAMGLDWRETAKLAGEHGIRYRTNAALQAFLAALAAAPTIPATGEANTFPARCPRCGIVGGHESDCIYAPVHTLGVRGSDRDATIPATGHAATVDPDDLRPWGYAPGEYVFRCRDCPADPPFEQRPLGDKRSWRCKPHAEAARDATGHAATEGEGATSPDASTHSRQPHG